MITVKKRRGARHISQLAAADGIQAVTGIEDKFLFVWQCFVNQFRVQVKNVDTWKLTSVLDLETHVVFTGYMVLKVTQVTKALVIFYYRDSNSFTLFEESIKSFDAPAYSC